MEGFHGNLRLHYSSPFVEMDLEKNGRSPHRNLIGQTRAEGKAHGMAQRPQEYLSVPLAALRWPSHSGKTPLCSPALSTVPLCTTWPCKGTTPLGRDPIISREGGGEGLQDPYRERQKQTSKKQRGRLEPGSGLSGPLAVVCADRQTDHNSKQRCLCHVGHTFHGLY